VRNHQVAAAALGIAALGIASIADLRAQQASQPVGVSVPFSAASGAGFVSGELRITQVTEQNGQLLAVGTLGIATDQSGAPGTAVTQVIVPVLAVSSTSTGAAMSFGGTAAAAPAVPGTPAGVAPFTPGAAPGGPADATAGAFGWAAAPASPTPGTQANCGPLRVELGPLDLAAALPGLRLERVVVDIAAPQGSVTPVNSLLCSADAALAAAASAGSAANTAPAIGAAQPGAVGTSGTAQGTAPPENPLQGFAESLNQVLGAL